MDSLLQDIRFGIRTALTKPSFTLVLVLVIALCISANAAIFSVVNSVLLRPLPFSNPDQLVSVWATDLEHGYPKSRMSPLDFIDVKEQNKSLADMAAFFDSSASLVVAGDPAQLRVAQVTPNFFSLLGFKPALGRFFSEEEGRVGNDNAIVLTHGLWQRKFGSNSGIIGEPVTLDGKAYTIIGVLPQSFKSTIPGLEGEPEVWTPLALAPAAQSRGAHWLMVVARLNPAASLDLAQQEMTLIARRLEQQYPETNKGYGIKLEPLHKAVVSDSQTALLVLLGAVIFVLLIACGNIANLLLSRASVRQKEMAIRSALGASRARLVRQLLTESLLLALMGGALGLFFAHWGINLLMALSPPGIPRIEEVQIDGRVLAFTFLISLLTSVFFGLAPAMQTSKIDLNEALKQGGRSASNGGTGRHFRNMLVVSQIALTLVLLICASLLGRSFMELLKVNPGFSAENVLSMQISLPGALYPEDQNVTAFNQGLINRVKSLPGVQAASVIDTLPLSRGPRCNSFTIDGRAPVPAGSEPCAEVRSISNDYFATMQIPLSAGRQFEDRDNEKATPVIIINESMLRRFWPQENPIGHRLTVFEKSREIIGVVRDVKNFGIDAEVTPEIYQPVLQAPPATLTLVLRTNTNPAPLADAVQGEVWAMDRSLPVYNVKTMQQYLSESISSHRFNMLLLAVFAAMALILAAMGIYGVISYGVSNRTHEIGLRMALGASRRQILKLIVGQGVTLTALGVAIGLAAAFAVTRIIGSLLFKIGITDLTTFLATTALLAGVALLASFIPAQRATKVDPMKALRQG